jgi:hypothetical protein
MRKNERNGLLQHSEFEHGERKEEEGFYYRLHTFRYNDIFDTWTAERVPTAKTKPYMFCIIFLVQSPEYFFESVPQS